MKTLLRLSWLSAALLVFAGCATTRQPPSPDTVNVLVNLPPTTSLIYADRIAEVFTDEVRHVFNQAGFNRPVENIHRSENAEAAPYLLTINLMEWRFDRIGNIECTFTAELKTPRGTRDLGVFSGLSLGMSRSPGWWGLVDSFDEAAQSTLIDLARAIAKSELLPARTPSPSLSSSQPLTHA